MQLSAFVCVVLVGLLLAEGTSSGSCGYVSNPNDKPREIRGFKPEFISTAIGFGKRETASKQDRYEKILRLLQEYPQSLFTNWMLQELNRNPDLAKRVARTIVVGVINRPLFNRQHVTGDNEQRENPGELSRSELIKSERTISFFK